MNNEVTSKNDLGSNDSNNDTTVVTLIAKWGKERITLEDLAGDVSIAEVKEMLFERTCVLPKRQKLIGLMSNKSGGGSTKTVGDDVLLADLKVKRKSFNDDQNNNIIHEFILMGTPEEQIFIDPADRDDLPDVVDDFDLDFFAGSSEVRTSHF